MPKYFIRKIQYNDSEMCKNFRKFYNALDQLGYIVDSSKGILELNNIQLEKVNDLMNENSLNIELDKIEE